MTHAQVRRTDTGDAMLDVAERLVQVRGFNAFSYADVARELGLTTAALHYHYPTKAELGEALVARYAAGFMAALDRIDGSGTGPSWKLAAYADLYGDVVRRQRMCLCGILAAEYETLGAGLQQAVAGFFEANEAWLAGVLRRGREDGVFDFAGAPLAEARALVSGLEGAMLVARSFGDVTRFESVARRLLAGLRRPSSRRRGGPTEPARG